MGTYTGSAVTNTASGATVTWRAKLVTTITNTETSVTIRCQCYMSVNSGQAPWFNKNRVTGTLTIAGATAKSYSGPSSDKTTFKNDVSLIDYTTSYTKTQNQQTKACSFKITVSSYSSWKGTSTATLTGGIIIPALSSHSINYDKNDDQARGSITSTIKYYSIDVPLATSGFELDNNTLIGWNTVKNPTELNPGIAYELGQTFTENLTQDKTLYAQWHLDYISPSIDNETLSVYRVNETNNYSEEGEKIHVQFNYVGGSSGAGQELIIPTIEIIIDNSTVYGPLLQSSTIGSFSDTYGTYSDGHGTYKNNESHTIIIIISDSNSNVSITRNITSATYPIDLLVDNNNVYMGIMSSAVNGQPLTMGKRAIEPDMDEQDIADFVASLNIGGGSAVDFVVEEGRIDGGLEGSLNFYRKWYSGKAEFWYKYSRSNGFSTAVWSSPIYYLDAIAFSGIWSGVFISTPHYVNVTSHDSQMMAVYPYSLDENGIVKLRMVSVGAKSNAAYAFSVYAVGEWE